MVDSSILTPVRRNSRQIGLILALAFVLLAWLHYRFVVAPLDYANKDFMSLWTGARAVLHGLNPYDEAVWQPLRAAYGSSWMPDPRAPFPLWTFLLMIPISLLPIQVAAAAWLTFQELLLVFSAVLLVWMFGRRRLSTGEVVILFLVAFTSVSTVLVQINGQMTYLLLALLSLFLYLLHRNRPFSAGAALALLALKPNPFIVLVPLLCLWLIWRRQWSVIAGGSIAGLGLFLLTWAIQPGWLPQWLNVRSKTEVVTITPTVWGLAAEVTSAWWAPLGLLITILLVLGVALYVFHRPALDPSTVTALGLSVSLMVTPYTWAYEHALLILPWLWLFARAPDRRHGQALWVLLAWVIPWAVFAVAAIRLKDSFGLLVPALTLLVLLIISSISTEAGHAMGFPIARRYRTDLS